MNVNTERMKNIWQPLAGGLLALAFTACGESNPPAPVMPDLQPYTPRLRAVGANPQGGGHEGCYPDDETSRWFLSLAHEDYGI